MPTKSTSPEIRPLSDRRYLPRGPVVPYRTAEIFLLFLDLAVIFFGIKVTEMIYSHTKGDRLIAEERAVQAAAREEETLTITTRTGKRDSLKIVEAEVLAARHADSLQIADLDTTFDLLVAAIEQGSVAVQARRADAEKAARTERDAKKKQTGVEVKITKAEKSMAGTQGKLAAIGDSIQVAQADIGRAEQALAITLSKRPEVVVPANNSASVGTSVSQGEIFSTVGLGRSFVNFGRAQVGLTASAGFGPDRSTVSGGGLFVNLPVIPNRASVDLGTGAWILTENEGGSDTSPYLSGSLRYALRQGRRIYLMGDTRVSHDRLWTGVGLSIGRR